MWVNKIDRIVCLNLTHRTDRLLDFTEQMEKYEIPFERISAIYDTVQGARGLRDTMVELFKEEIEKGTEHLLVFEDDCEIIVEKIWLDETMNKVMEQLPPNYHMVLLGCQLTNRITEFRSPNLIPVSMAFSTHAVLYSLQGMKEIMARDMGWPIDNWTVEHIQKLGHSYCTFPLLCSQKPGKSDIGGQHISWKPFIEDRFQQKINEYHARR